MELRKKRILVVGGALAGAAALGYVLFRPRAARLNEAALRQLSAKEAAEWRLRAAMGEAIPCPLQLSPLQPHCRPQTSTPEERAAALARQKKAAENPGLPPPIGSSPERIAAYRARVMQLNVYPAAFAGIKTAYNRVGEAILGKPTAPAMSMDGKGVVQTFSGSGGYPAAIFARRGGPGFVVRGGFYGIYGRFTKALGWPLGEEERVPGPSPIDRHSIGIAKPPAWHSSQRFSRGLMTWNPVTGNVAVQIGNRPPWNSIRRPPRKEKAWYEEAWDFTVEHGGTIVAVAEAVTLLPGVVAAVGVGVVLAPFTGGASLIAAGGVVVGAALTVKATKQGVDGLLAAADDGDVGAGAAAAQDL